MHGLQAAVDVSFQEHGAEDAQLRRLVGGAHREVRRLPVAPHPEPVAQPDQRFQRFKADAVASETTPYTCRAATAEGLGLTLWHLRHAVLGK